MKMQKDCFNLLAGSRNDHVTSSAGLLIGLSYSKYKMVFGQAGRVFARKFSTSAVARSQHWQQYGIPGANLPFDIKNRYKLTLFFALFFSSGFSAPFFLVRHQILKR